MRSLKFKPSPPFFWILFIDLSCNKLEIIDKIVIEWERWFLAQLCTPSILWTFFHSKKCRYVAVLPEYILYKTEIRCDTYVPEWNILNKRMYLLFFLRIQSEFRIFIKILTALKNGFGYLLKLVRSILYYEILESWLYWDWQARF